MSWPAKSAINWLHLTDLHVGQPRESDRYENIEQALLDDLRRVKRDDEDWRWDVVFFTGDLAFRGSDEEYAGVNRRLARILEAVKVLNGNRDEDRPVLLAVPGNHDLARPDPLTASRVRAAWRGSPLYREAFWRGENPDLRGVVDSAFASYQRWLRHHPFRRPDEVHDGGLVAGDFAATVEVRGVRLGVVGLNSAFLHLGDGGEGELDLRLEQLRAVCGDYEGWARNHDIRVLLTHHPVEWLCPDGRTAFEEEIRHGDRFDIHLYGHMHAGGHAARPGAEGFRHSMQGRSLFGAEEDGFPRMHGYAMGRFWIMHAKAGAADEVKARRAMDLFVREGWRLDGRGWAFGPLGSSGRSSWFVRAELGPVRAPVGIEAAGFRGAKPNTIKSPDEFAGLIEPAATDSSSPLRLLVLSASVPHARTEAMRRVTEAAYVRRGDQETIRKSVTALAARAKKGGIPLIFGGHPSIAAALLPVALDAADTDQRIWLYLVQHAHFNWHLHDTIAELARCTGVKPILVEGVASGGASPTDAALAHLRACMFAPSALVGGVFIGGMSGMKDEFKRLREKPSMLTYAFGVSGGAAAELLLREPDTARGKLKDSAPLWSSPESAVDAVFQDLG